VFNGHPLSTCWPRNPTPPISVKEIIPLALERGDNLRVISSTTTGRHWHHRCRFYEATWRSPNQPSRPFSFYDEKNFPDLTPGALFASQQVLDHTRSTQSIIGEGPLSRACQHFITACFVCAPGSKGEGGVERHLVMGADYYESSEERACCAKRGAIAPCVGHGTTVKGGAPGGKNFSPPLDQKTPHRPQRHDRQQGNPQSEES